MLNLAAPLDSLEGLTLYRDHQAPGVVYYFPDEVGISRVDGSNDDISVTVYMPDEAIAAGDLNALVGSVFSIGVRCYVNEARLERARQQLKGRLDIPAVELVAPPWESGSVDLLLFDSTSDPSATANKDSAVSNVVGSRRPSLVDGTLQAIFQARLDRRATAVIASALKGRAGLNAGVIYDLKFAGLLPAIDLVMHADLNRVADYIRASLGVNAYYVSADVSAAFSKMREEGVIKVEMTSMLADAESQKQADQAAKDFYDVLMRQLFAPIVSPADALAGAAGALSGVKTSIVNLSFTYTHSEQERIVEVDYRKRSAVTRQHNPQAALRSLAGLGGDPERVVSYVPLSAAWREVNVQIAAPDAFKDPTLEEIETVVWHGRDAVLDAEHAREDGLRMPEDVQPIIDLAFTREKPTSAPLAWTLRPDEPAFYRWQARVRNAPSDAVDSPPLVWSEPHTSTSRDLDLFADQLAPTRRVVLRLGGGLDASLDSVEARVQAKDASGQVVAERTLHVDGTTKEASWTLRRSEGTRLSIEQQLTYRWKDGRVLTRPTLLQLDQEILANSPFARTVVVTPFVTGAIDDLLELDVIVQYASGDYSSRTVARLRGPDFAGPDLQIPVLSAKDTVSWSASALSKTTGQLEPISAGSTLGGVISIALSRVRLVRLAWTGQSVEDAGLRSLRVLVRSLDESGQAVDTKTADWRTSDVADKQVSVLRAASIQYSIERRYPDGHMEVQPYAPVTDDSVILSA
jgi:hypothetical protein